MKSLTTSELTSYSLYTDEELFLLIKEDVKAAYHGLVERWDSKLYNKAYKRIQDVPLAMILVKQVFAELWEYRHKLRVKKISDHLIGSLKSKLYLLYEQKELPGTFAEPLNHFAMAILEADVALTMEEIKGLIKQWLVTQPQERIEIFDLKYKANFTSKQISEKLDISLNTVNEQLKISRMNLNEYVQRFLVKNLDKKGQINMVFDK